MNERREKIIKAIDCCMKSDCRHCPMLDEYCDEADMPYEWMPLPLMEEIRKELDGPVLRVVK